MLINQWQTTKQLPSLHKCHVIKISWLYLMLSQMFLHIGQIGLQFSAQYYYGPQTCKCSWEMRYSSHWLPYTQSACAPFNNEFANVLIHRPPERDNCDIVGTNCNVWKGLWQVHQWQIAHLIPWPAKPHGDYLDCVPSSVLPRCQSQATSQVHPLQSPWWPWPPWGSHRKPKT